jgi:hypothetical protein
MAKGVQQPTTISAKPKALVLNLFGKRDCRIATLLAMTMHSFIGKLNYHYILYVYRR